MRNRYSPLAQLSFERNSISSRGRGCIQDIMPFHPLILEQFVHHNRVEDAFDAYRHVSKALQNDLMSSNHKFAIPQLRASLLLIDHCVFVCPADSTVEAYRLANLKNACLRGTLKLPHYYFPKAFMFARVQDLSELSRRTPVVSHELMNEFLPSRDRCPTLSINEFQSTVAFLVEGGLLTVPFGSTDLGDFRHIRPLCPDYGYSRGTPIDRFYLGQFVAEFRDTVIGVALEIGGRRSNKHAYGFSRTTEYLAMDMHVDDEVDVVGDAHNSEAHPEGRFDSIILFNVLEHCDEPWTVVRNVHRWLKTGGVVLCAVPNAQRIHGDPKDYWRILPDGFSSLFKSFAITKLKTYGNLLTVHASLSGIAAEELTQKDLEQNNPDYPVVTCIAARKKDVTVF
jgi:SAM-dependent methyltransferase